MVHLGLDPAEVKYDQVLSRISDIVYLLNFENCPTSFRGKFDQNSRNLSQFFSDTKERFDIQKIGHFIDSLKKSH